MDDPSLREKAFYLKMDIKILALLTLTFYFVNAKPCDKIDINAINAKREELAALEAKLKQQEQSEENRLKLEQLHKEQQQLVEDLRKKTAEEEEKRKKLEEELLSSEPCAEESTSTEGPAQAQALPCKKKYIVTEDVQQSPCKKKYVIVKEAEIEQDEPKPIVVQAPCPNTVLPASSPKSSEGPCYKKFVVLHKNAEQQQENGEILVETPCPSAPSESTTPSPESSSVCYKKFVVVSKDGQKTQDEQEIVVQTPCAEEKEEEAPTEAPKPAADASCFKKFVVVQKEGETGPAEEIIVQAPCSDVAATAEPPTTTTTTAPCQKKYVIVERQSEAAPAIDSEGPKEEKTEEETEKESENDNINWTSYDINRLAEASNSESMASDDNQEEEEKPASEKSVCPDGWEVFQDSCYMIERDEKLPLDKAEEKCQSIGANLFVPNSKEEYDTIINDTPMHYFTWVGLFKKDDEMTPQWQTSDALDFKEINWLSNPYSEAGNGWTTVSQCAAHWRPAGEVGKYVFWYPCVYSYYYVCERNATIHGVETKKFF